MDLFLPPRKKTVTVLFCLLCLSGKALADSNYFRFINNFNFPMTISITPLVGTATNLCGGGTSNAPVNAFSPSCEFQFDTAGLFAKNSGTITLTKQNDPASCCTYSYQYTGSTNYFIAHSEQISLQHCQGSLMPTEITLINDSKQVSIRPLAEKLSGYLLAKLDKAKAEQAIESFSLADCGGSNGDNCLVASPDADTVYLPNGSTLNAALKLQTQLDRYEPLNFAQFIGSHNSTISSHYTSSTTAIDLSYGDPATNHFENATLTPYTTYSVLCYKPFSLPLTPVAPLQWYLQTVRIVDDVQSAFSLAETACQVSGGTFAVPTVSYWMNDALSVINANGTNPYNVLVNYKMLNKVWTPNIPAAKADKYLLLKQ